MSLRRLLAIARKETIQIWRDPRSLLVVLIMPVMLMSLLGYGINLDQTHVPLCVYDREGSQQSQDLLKRFVSNRYFDLTLDARDYGQLTDAIDRGRCTIGIVIPLYFSERLAQGETVGVQAIVDGTDNNTADLVIGYAQQIVAGFSGAVQMDFLQRQGLSTFYQSLTIEARTWFNEDLESRNFIVPGVVAIVMAVIGTFLSSLTIAREWERGTMEQLISTPVTRGEVIAGKLLPYLLIGMFDAVECIAIAVWWFHAPFRGSVPGLLAASALFLLAVLLLGFLISAATGNQLAASQFSLVLTFLPSFLLSGFAFPIDQMPVVVREITRVIPARYYVTALKSLFLKGSGVAAIAGQMAAMALFALAAGALTMRSFKKKLA
jgi:drug efflux transport system permease protein